MSTSSPAAPPKTYQPFACPTGRSSSRAAVPLTPSASIGHRTRHRGRRWTSTAPSPEPRALPRLRSWWFPGTVASGSCSYRFSGAASTPAQATSTASTSTQATTRARRGSKSCGAGAASQFPTHRCRTVCPPATMMGSLLRCSTTSTGAPPLGITSYRRTWGQAGSP